MEKARTVFEAALRLMDEKDRNKEYERNATAILNTLIGECYTVSADTDWRKLGGWTPLIGLDDEIGDLDLTLTLSVLPYGLAAMLYLHEDPVKSQSWWSVYQERLERCRRERPVQAEPIEDVYGGLGHWPYGRW